MEMKLGNRIAEDSFEKARKAFFGTAPTTPNLNRREYETSVARSDARQFTVVERLPIRNSVLESERDKLQACAISAADACNGPTPWISSQNSPEETAAINVALYALAVLKRA
jgi:hypothetical protein